MKLRETAEGNSAIKETSSIVTQTSHLEETSDIEILTKIKQAFLTCDMEDEDDSFETEPIHKKLVFKINHHGFIIENGQKVNPEQHQKDFKLDMQKTAELEIYLFHFQSIPELDSALNTIAENFQDLQKNSYTFSFFEDPNKAFQKYCTNFDFLGKDSDLFPKSFQGIFQVYDSFESALFISIASGSVFVYLFSISEESEDF